MIGKSARFAGLFVAALLLSSSAGAAPDGEFYGRVVGVHDGDTVTVLRGDHSQVRVRLAEIDAPECGQPGSRASKAALSALVFNKEVKVVPNGTSHDRIVGWLVLGSPAFDASASMVDRGQAWVEPRYVKRRELFGVEQARRRARVGLWALPAEQLTPPWDWRHAGNPMKRDCVE